MLSSKDINKIQIIIPFRVFWNTVFASFILDTREHNENSCRLSSSH